VAIGEEITEKKRNEAELIKAKEKAEESDRLKSAFLANISHEIRTPMNGILGFADLLKSPDLSPENQQEFIEVIEQSGQRMLNVINDLIDISKIEAGEMNLKIYDTNLNLLVEELYKLFKPKADEKKLEFSYSAGISDEESIVMTDGGKLYQILANLIKNAIKFTNLGHIEFGYSQSDYQLNFFVKDTGIGIPEEQREIIFERFRQGSNSLNRKYEGAGLGLTISKAYVELLGGQMWVESELYQGTTFGFSIPRHSGNQSSEINPHEDNLSEKNMDITVLIAEDDESNRLFIRKALENNVSTLLFACTGAEAVEMVETHEKIDVVLMDLKLPVMDGFEATRQIKRLRPDLSVIAQTTFINTEDKEKALAAGCSDFMTKPIKRKALLDAILKSLTLWLIILLVSCTPWTAPVQPDPAKPMVVEAHGYVVPVDSIQKPLIIPAGKPTQVRIGKLPEFPAYSNVILAGTLKRIQAGQPYIWTPGENNLNIPKVVKATEKPFFSHPPEVVLAKDAYSKDINPQNFSNYNKLQGLKHDQIRNLIQDRLGNIWFSTDDGVTKFDGKYFSHYSTDQGLNNSLILSVLQDSKNNLWFGTFGGGVTRYDGRYFTNFTTEEGLPNNIVNSIYEDRSGNIWFGTGGGATRYDGQNFTQYSTATGLCSNDVRAIIEDLKGNFWIATNGGGISKFDGKSFYNYNTDQGLPINYISTLFLDQAGNLWIGTSNRGALKFDGCYFTYFTEKEGLCSNYVKTIIQDDDGSIWIGTSENGISRYDGKYFTQFTEKEGLGINIVRSSLKDRNGNLWFGTRGAGVSKFQGKIFTHLTEHEGLSNSRIMSILEDKSGNFWFGSFGGYVTKLSTREVNGEKQNYYTYLGEKEGLLFNRIYSIIQDNDGNIWFGTDGGGVSKFDGKIMTTYTMKEGLCDGSIRKIMQDRDGNFWFCSYGGGVSKFDGKTFTNYSMKEGLSAKNILCVFQDKKGNIWFGTDGGGVTRFDGQQFTHYSKKEGMSSNTVYSIMDDNDGNLWFGTAGEGVSKFDGKYFTNFSEKQGLSNNYVLSILKDKKGNLWFGTRFGPNVLKAGSLEREQKQEVSLFKTYGYEDGFLGLGCNLGAIAEDHFGKIWIGTNDRLSTFHPEGEISDTIPPNIQLTNIQLFNEKIPWSDLFSKQDSVIELKNGVNVSNFRFKSISQWYAIPEQLSLSHTDNYLTFDFIGITQTQAKKVRYQYKLEGVDKTWSSLTDRTEASYGNLNNGKYTFRVKAVNSEGYWSNEINYTFTIRPPWWKTWWFYLVLSSAIVSLIYSYIRFREQKLQNDKIKLQKKVDEQTRELTEKNNVLITQKNEILLKNQDIEKKNNELQIINSEKDKFFSVIAHDVRGPLSSFLSLTEILTEDLHKMTKDDLEQIANSMHTSAQNLYELLSNLLDWSRMQRGIISSSPKIVNLNELALNCSALIIDAAKNKPVELTLNIPEGTVIFADANMIAAVIRNLLTNAVKFTPPGGKAALTAHITGENEIEIAVSDTGIGIPENMIQQLFKLSSGGASRIGTAGEPSTGLGLLICKEFIEMHDGQIRVESEVGKGSTFRFNLKIHA
jgi:signal transduction histidine kinase/ligand-binding sensor domain-containing protein/CheY-like chemotaxis protein